MTFLPETVKSTFIELVKSVFRYIYLKVSIEALSLKVAIVSKADLASLGQSDIDMLSQFYLFFFFFLMKSCTQIFSAAIAAKKLETVSIRPKTDLSSVFIYPF